MLTQCFHHIFRTLLLLFYVFFLTIPADIQAGEQAERAIKGVLKLISDGKLASGSTLKILVKQGNIRNYWGVNFDLKNEWEEKTGILIDANVMPQMPVLDLLSSKSDFDFTIARQREYPDLFTKGLIQDLTPYVKKYGMVLDDNPINGYLHPKAQTEFDGKVVAIPADGDIAVLYLRKDMLDEPANKEAFKKQFDRELEPPKTWDEYLDLISFFHDPDNNFYGSCEERDLHTGWMFWMIRYASQANPTQYLFDDDMRPLINSPEGIRATEQYIATIPYSPPDALVEGNNYSYTLPFFKNGNGFAFILTMSAAKMLNSRHSKLRGKVMISPMPGNIVGDVLVQKSSFIYGNNIVISTSSKHPELAFLYAMWLSDPEISSRSVRVSAGMADPFRYNHLTSADLHNTYTKQALDAVLAQSLTTIPAGTGLPGDNEYIQALNVNIWRAGKKELTPSQAMEETARAWELITEKYGRAKQIVIWKSFKQKFPSAVSTSLTQ
ncbi:extracellular solute-binding protein [Desulfosediminicola flagellatus]|uniref:extracellular solute-binding protein n=1 Tax=Desulfosediminicola flagellatus TaxID=2569541 RepID=UPI0010AC13F6|nr:extracellular solute-binding protein [Desulfosediminicola flagellatus]